MMVFNHSKRSKQTTLTVLLVFLTVSIVLIVPETSAKTTPENTHEKATIIAEKGINTNNDDRTMEWNKTYGYPDEFWDDEGRCVIQTSDGGYVLTGYTITLNGNWNDDVWLIKTDSNGNEEWNQTHGGTNDEMGNWVDNTTDGGYIITGYTTSYGAGDRDVWLIKTDANGNHVWNQTYGGTVSDWGFCVEQTSDLGYIIVGYTRSFAVGQSDVWLIKTDSNGDHLWNKTFGAINNDGGYSVEQTPDDGYIITGYAYSIGVEQSDVWLIKTDENGVEEWSKFYGGVWDDFGYKGTQTADGGYIITGYTQSYGAGENDFWLIKTDEDGNAVWNNTYGGEFGDIGRCVEQTADGGYIIAGSTNSFGLTDVWLVKTDTNGVAEWNQTYGGIYADIGYCVQQTTDGGYIIVGSTRSFGFGGSDVWLIKDSGEPPVVPELPENKATIIFLVVLFLIPVLMARTLILKRKKLNPKDSLSEIQTNTIQQEKTNK